MGNLKGAFRLRGDDRVAQRNKRGLLIAILWVVVFVVGFPAMMALLAVSSYDFPAFFVAIVFAVCVAVGVVISMTTDGLEQDELKDAVEYDLHREREEKIGSMGDDFNLPSLLQLYVNHLLGQLPRYFGKHCYFVAVFHGCINPEIVAYADSEGKFRPSSAKRREENPSYYNDAGYMVCKTLAAGAVSRNPVASHVRNDTLEADFNDERQLFGSRMYVAVADGFALAVACDEAGVFDRRDARVDDWIMDIACQMACDVAINGKDEHKEAKTVRTMLGDEYV